MSTLGGKPPATGDPCLRRPRPGTRGCGIEHSPASSARSALGVLRAPSAVEVAPDPEPEDDDIEVTP